MHRVLAVFVLTFCVHGVAHAQDESALASQRIAELILRADTELEGDPRVAARTVREAQRRAHALTTTVQAGCIPDMTTPCVRGAAGRCWVSETRGARCPGYLRSVTRPMEGTRSSAVSTFVSSS